jgi:two-component system chemotaxis sensor kinase CheA
MTVDITEVRDLFFEESFESLDIMESNLLDLDIGTTDREMINSIFRSAHSIKGSAGIFKFEKVITFAHVAETLLDEMRNGEHIVSQAIIDILLRFVDVMRMMLSALQENRGCDEQSVLDCQNQLKYFLKTPIEEAVTLSTQSTEKMTSVAEPEVQQTTPKTSQQEISSPSSSTANRIGWFIQFKPYLSMLKTGNDPINLFRELANLGELTVKVDTHQLPHLTEMDPQACYLSWELTLHTAVERTVIEELFEWVEDECELSITPIGKQEAQQFDTIETTATEAETETEPQPKSPATQPVPQPEVIPTPAETPEVTTYQAAPESALVVKVEDGAKTSKESTLDEPGSRNLMGQTVEASSIRVGIDKIDHLINIVGELVITQSMLDQVGENFDESKIVQLRDGLSQLERNTRELQESVMRVRMLPISFSFNRFPRLVHDLSLQLGKKVELKLSGEQTELDKTVLEKMSDPLVHLVRNALDHGVEMPEQRRQAGKSEVGTLHLHAFHQGGSIVIQISDDGAGVDLDKVRAKAIKQKLLTAEETVTDEQLYELIFQPGFSTVTQVNDLSGRGVGMDVVRRNIRSLGGTIDIQSKPGQGTTFNIRLPLTLAILDGQLVRVGQQIYILSLLSIIESLRVKPQLVNSLAGRAEVYKLRDEYIPILRLYALFDIASAATQLDQGLLVVVEGDGHKIGLFVDELLSQQQIVIKSLETNYKQVSGISGATILGDGNVALILDIAGLIKLFRSQTNMPMFSGVTL